VVDPALPALSSLDKTAHLFIDLPRHPPSTLTLEIIEVFPKEFHIKIGLSSCPGSSLVDAFLP